MQKRLVALVLMLLAPTLALAQGTTSRVAGTVTDKSGGVIPGATVTLASDATSIKLSTTTNDTGSYAFEAVQVGRYTLAVELQGFKRFVAPDVPVTIGEPTTVNAILEPGGIAESVVVNAASQIVQTSSGNLGSTFDQRTLESLPILGGRGRNPLDLVLTQPGVVSGANTGGAVHVHGARDRAWNFTLDGIDSNESSAGGSNFSPLRTNPDALSEFKVLTGNQTAEYGRNSGGQVAMVTRTGSNRVSGTLFYFDRRPDYNANEWENNRQRLAKRIFTQKVPGFSVGGPIRRNRTFFFVNNQWLRATQNTEITRTVFTATARQGIWRYSTAGRNLPFGAATGASVDASGNPVVPIGTYNIPARDPQGLGFDPTIQQIVAGTPLPNNFTAGDGLNTAGFTFSAAEEEKQMDFVTKVDHTFNQRHSAFLRYSRGYQNTLCDQVNGGQPAFPGTTCFVDTTRDPYNWAGNWRWSAAGNVVNELVVGQNHFTFDFVSPMADPSRFSFAAPVTIPESFEVGNLRSVDTLQFVDNLSWLKGSHSFRFGTNMRFQRHTDTRGSVAGFNVSPTLNFSTATNAVDPATFGIPSDLNVQFDRPVLQTHINFLLGRVGSINQAFVQQGDGYGPGGTLFDFKADYPEIDFYAQDTWKPRSNLTLDLGLRYEAKLSPRNPDDLIRRPNQSLAVGTQPSNTLRWEKGKLYDDDWNNLAPSVGAAWDPRGDGRSVIRGNYRMAFDRINTFLLSSNIFQNIPGITTSVVNTAFGQAGGRLRQGLPSLQPTVSPESFLQPPAVGVGSNIRVVDPNFQTPITHGWAVTYQRQLFSQTLFEIAYVGRRAEHLFGAYDANQAEILDNGFLDAYKIVQAGGESPLMNQLLQPHTDRLTGETGSAMVRRLSAANLTLNSVAALAATYAARVQSGRQLTDLAGLGPYFFYRFPQFLGTVFVIDSEDYSRYHAMELKLERRFSSGYSYLVGYTLSKSKDTRSYDPAFTVVSGANNQSASSTPFNIKNRDLNYALSDFDRTHVFQAQGTWELPFGQGRRFAGGVGRITDVLIGGWTLSGQMVGQSGRPMTVYGGSNTFTNVVQTPANCTGCSPGMGGIHEENGLVFFFTPEERAKFSTPAPGEFGNTGRNYFRGPGSYFVNLSLAKRTRITGRQILEIRLDSTNTLNHAVWGFPTLTSTSNIFGRNLDPIGNNSRKGMLAVKYYF